MGLRPGQDHQASPWAARRSAAAVVGVDFNPETIEWCLRSIPGVTFQRNDLQPPLPFRNGSFDFVYAISVFTHLDEAGWSDWIRELRRVMTEGGVLLFTTHGKNYLPKLLPDERELFTRGRPVFRAKTAQGKKCFAAYHPEEFVLGSLPEGLRVLSHTDSSDVPALSQDVWVLTKDGLIPSGSAGEQLVPPVRRAGSSRSS